MKKLVNVAFILFGAFALVSLTACNKDKMDEYGADKKISKVYYSYSETYQDDNYFQPKTLLEQWNWNNDDLVESIENYNDEGDLEFMINFTYNEKHRVSHVECRRYSLRLDYYYDQETKLMNQMDLFFGGQMVGTCSITYQDGKMHLLSATVYDDYFKKDAAVLNPFSMLLPKQISDRLITFENHLSQRDSNDSYTVFATLTWEGNNIAKVVGEGMGEMIVITAQYDNKNNPVYGFILGQPGGGGLVQNNITMLTATEGHHSETVMASYQYDSDDYPVKATHKEVSNYYTAEQSLYFEYY